MSETLVSLFSSGALYAGSAVAVAAEPFKLAFLQGNKMVQP